MNFHDFHEKNHEKSRKSQEKSRPVLISARARRIRTDISTAALKNLRRTDISTIRADISTDAPIQVAFFSERWFASAVGRLLAEACVPALRCAVLAVWSCSDSNLWHSLLKATPLSSRRFLLISIRSACQYSGQSSVLISARADISTCMALRCPWLCLALGRALAVPWPWPWPWPCLALALPWRCLGLALALP